MQLQLSLIIFYKFSFKSFSERCHWRWHIWWSTYFCTQKISLLTTSGIHKYLHFHSFKNFTVDSYQEVLKQPDFPNYELFDNVSGAYSNFFQKTMMVIDKIAPCRKIRIKGYIQKWLDSKVLQKLNARDKLFRKFKKSRVNIDKEFNKKAKQMPQN